MFAKLPELLLVGSLLVVLPGCRKSQDAAPPQAPAPASASAQNETQQPAPVPPQNVPPANQTARTMGPPVVPPPPPAQIPSPQNGKVSATLSELSMQLRLYVARTRTAPKTFAEFVANSGVQVPPPPSGTHYAIQSGQVVLER